MVLEGMVEARSDFAKKRSLRENKSPPILILFFTKTHIIFQNYYLYGFLKVTILFKMSFFLSDALNEHDVVKDTSKDL